MCGHRYPFSLIFSHTVLLQWVHYSRDRFPRPHTHKAGIIYSLVFMF